MSLRGNEAWAISVRHEPGTVIEAGCVRNGRRLALKRVALAADLQPGTQLLVLIPPSGDEATLVHSPPDVSWNQEDVNGELIGVGHVAADGEPVWQLHGAPTRRALTPDPEPPPANVSQDVSDVLTAAGLARVDARRQDQLDAEARSRDLSALAEMRLRVSSATTRDEAIDALLAALGSHHTK